MSRGGRSIYSGVPCSGRSTVLYWTLLADRYKREEVIGLSCRSREEDDALGMLKGDLSSCTFNNVRSTLEW
jgi:hypothetical protein